MNQNKQKKKKVRLTPQKINQKKKIPKKSIN